MQSIAQCSPILQLPREIRDLIYEFVVIQDVIPLECAITKISCPRLRRAKLITHEDLKPLYLLRSRRVHRRIWSLPPFDVGIVSGSPDPTDAVYMTYQLASNDENVLHAGDVSNNSLGIRLLQTCKQIYDEASKIFYGRNVFSFTGDFRIPTTLAFLCDRPARSLLLIESLELALMEDTNMAGTTLAHYPQQRRSTDSLVLRYAYNHYTELCTLLSTPRIQLRRLYLTMETTALGRRMPPVCTFAGCSSYESSRTSSPRPWIPSWLEPLLNITGLDSAEIIWISDSPQLHRIADTVTHMRQHMLRSNQFQDKKMSEAAVYFRMLATRRTRGAEPAYWTEDGNLCFNNEWKLCVLDNDGLRRQDVEPFDPLELRAHVREILTTRTTAYVSHYVLNST